MKGSHEQIQMRRWPSWQGKRWIARSGLSPFPFVFVFIITCGVVGQSNQSSGGGHRYRLDLSPSHRLNRVLYHHVRLTLSLFSLAKTKSNCSFEKSIIIEGPHREHIKSYNSRFQTRTKRKSISSSFSSSLCCYHQNKTKNDNHKLTHTQTRTHIHNPFQSK